MTDPCLCAVGTQRHTCSVNTEIYDRVESEDCRWWLQAFSAVSAKSSRLLLSSLKTVTHTTFNVSSSIVANNRAVALHMFAFDVWGRLILYSPPGFIYFFGPASCLWQPLSGAASVCSRGQLWSIGWVVPERRQKFFQNKRLWPSFLIEAGVSVAIKSLFAFVLWKQNDKEWKTFRN